MSQSGQMQSDRSETQVPDSLLLEKMFDQQNIPFQYHEMQGNACIIYKFEKLRCKRVFAWAVYIARAFKHKI